LFDLTSTFSDGFWTNCLRMAHLCQPPAPIYLHSVYMPWGQGILSMIGGTPRGQEKRSLGMLPRLLTDARETSYEIFSPLLTAECSTVKLSVFANGFIFSIFIYNIAQIDVITVRWYAQYSQPLGRREVCRFVPVTRAAWHGPHFRRPYPDVPGRNRTLGIGNSEPSSAK
jgi:hypothetical protein